MAVQISKVEQYTQSPSYSNLIEVVSLYLNRDDIATTETIPFFINAAEKTILRNLRMPSMEKTVSFKLEDYDSEDGWVRIPSDYLEMRYVWTDKGTLQRIPFDQIFTYKDEPNSSDQYSSAGPIEWTKAQGVWAINGDRMYIRGVSESDDVFLTYYQDIPEINSATQYNVLLDLVPDAFVFLSVAEGWNFLQEHDKANMWMSLGMKRLDSVMQQVYQAEFSGSTLAIRPHSY